MSKKHMGSSIDDFLELLPVGGGLALAVRHHFGLVLNQYEAVLVAFSAQEQWVKEVPTLIADLVRVFPSWGMKLKIRTHDLSRVPFVIPGLAHMPKFSIRLWPDAPNATSRAVCRWRVIPQDKEWIGNPVERFEFARRVGLRPRLNDTIEARRIDSFPGVGSLDVGTVSEVRALLSFSPLQAS